MLNTIVNLKEYTDEKMKKLRLTYFRPNIKDLKKTLK